MWGLVNPIGALSSEVSARYLGVGAAGASFMKLLLSLVYIIGVAGALFTRRIRAHKGWRALLIIAAIWFAYFTLLEGTKIHLYLIHMTPLYAILLAVWAHHCWAEKRAVGRATAVAVCGLLLIQVAGNGYVIARDSYHKSYLPAVDFLNRNSGPLTTITGPAELSFGLNNRDALLDDKYLGYHNQRRPDFIVVEARYEQEHTDAQTRYPEIYTHVTALLSEEYTEVYNNAGFIIYTRK